MGDAGRHHRPGPPARCGAKRGERQQALGRCRGGWSTKVHLITDAHGNLLDFLLTPGQAHESRMAPALLVGWQAEYVLADRAYDGGPVREVIAGMGAQAVIPPHPCRKSPSVYDSYLYKARHATENGFAKLKQFRSLATRYDKTARNYAAHVAIACIMVWLRL